MGATGPGNLTSLSFNTDSPLVTSQFIEGFAINNEMDSYDNAQGWTLERGSLKKTATATIYDYSAYTTLKSLMTARTVHDLVATYVDGSTQTLANGVVRVKPVANVVTDVLGVLVGATATVDTGLDTTGTGWSDLGICLGVPETSFDYPFDGTTGEGLPYFSSGRITCDNLVLPAATYSDLDALINVASKVAFKLPNGDWQVHDQVFISRHYANEDGNTPRGVRLRFTGVDDDWATLLYYHDGTTAASSPSDYFAGCEFEFSAFHYTESSLVTWA